MNSCYLNLHIVLIYAENPCKENQFESDTFFSFYILSFCAQDYLVSNLSTYSISVPLWSVGHFLPILLQCNGAEVNV